MNLCSTDCVCTTKCDFETVDLIKGEYGLNWTSISSDFFKHNLNVVL